MSSLKQQRRIARNPRVIEPYGNYIVVALEKAEKATIGGIALPDELVAKDRQVLARVIRVGQGQRAMTNGVLLTPFTSVDGEAGGDLFVPSAWILNSTRPLKKDSSSIITAPCRHRSCASPRTPRRQIREARRGPPSSPPRASGLGPAWDPRGDRPGAV